MADASGRVQAALDTLRSLVNEELLSTDDQQPVCLPLITISESPMAISHRRPLTLSIQVMSSPMQRPAQLPLITVSESPMAISHRHAATPVVAPTAPPLIIIEEVPRSSPLAKLRWGASAESDTPTRADSPMSRTTVSTTSCGTSTSPPPATMTSDAASSPIQSANSAEVGTSPMSAPPPVDVEAMDSLDTEVLRAHVRSLAISNELLREDQRARAGDLDERTADLANVRAELATATAELARAASERDTSVEALRELEAASLATGSELASAVAERSKALALVADLQSRVDDAAATVAELTRQNTELCEVRFFSYLVNSDPLHLCTHSRT